MQYLCIHISLRAFNEIDPWGLAGNEIYCVFFCLLMTHFCNAIDCPFNALGLYCVICAIRYTNSIR